MGDAAREISQNCWWKAPKQPIIPHNNQPGKVVMEMKKRRVLVSIELETSQNIKDLKVGVDAFFDCEETKVIQVQANVIKKEQE